MLTHATQARPEGIGVGDIVGPIVGLFVLAVVMAWVVVVVIGLGAAWVVSRVLRTG